jgi:hypothetical protein
MEQVSPDVSVLLTSYLLLLGAFIGLAWVFGRGPWMARKLWRLHLWLLSLPLTALSRMFGWGAKQLRGGK